MRQLLLTSLLLIASLTQAADPAPLVRVNGTAIPASRLETLLEVALNQGGKDSPELRQQIRGQLIAYELLRQAAVKKKLHNDPLVAAAREEAGTRAMIKRYVELYVKPDSVSEKTVRDRYESIVSTLGEHEYKLSLIAVASESEARTLIKQIGQNDASFASLAGKHSLLASGKGGGAVDWLSFRTPVVEGQTAGLPYPVAQAIAKLEKPTPGTLLAAPIAAEDRYWIVRVDETRATQLPDYEAVAPGLRRLLETQALERASANLMEGLVAAAKIE
jgi:peptidyl-prolyl cis-trans isomerase C